MESSAVTNTLDNPQRCYRVVYVGDGASDCSPASQAHRIFARDDLLAYCKKNNLDCTPFDDLNDVVRGLELLTL